MSLIHQVYYPRISPMWATQAAVIPKVNKSRRPPTAFDLWCCDHHLTSLLNAVFSPEFKCSRQLSILMTVHVSVDLIFCFHLKHVVQVSLPSDTMHTVKLGGLVRNLWRTHCPNKLAVSTGHQSLFWQIPLPSICHCLSPKIANRCGN